MNITTEEDRINTYRSSPDTVKELYGSESLGAKMSEQYATFQITQPFRIYGDIVGDTILGFHKISEMPGLFQQKLGVSADESQRMTSQLIELLSPIVQKEEAEERKKKEELRSLADTFAQAKETRQQKITSEGNKEPEYGDVIPLRTMEGDINRIHGYGAYVQARDEDEKADQKEVPQQEHSAIPRPPLQR